MLIGVSGSPCAGRTEVTRYLNLQGFTSVAQTEVVEPSGFSPKNADDSSDSSYELAGPVESSSVKALTFPSTDKLMDFVTTSWHKNYVITIEDIATLDKLSKRPFFLHIAIEAPLLLRYKRHEQKYPNAQTFQSFSSMSDIYSFSKQYSGLSLSNRANVTIVNDTESLQLLYIKLNNVNLMEPTRLRPSWDAYFMQLADLAAQRSNCMKRRVGCVLVRGKVVVATGYNGTPRGLTNCNEGGCPRCNSGNGSGTSLATCLCLHAEENALLEAGRDRVGAEATLYCNTCPCLTCSIKIVQSGINEVVYSQSYSMDEHASEVMKHGGIRLRQYTPPSTGVHV